MPKLKPLKAKIIPTVRAEEFLKKSVRWLIKKGYEGYKGYKGYKDMRLETCNEGQNNTLLLY